jgi:hypothetical protein
MRASGMLTMRTGSGIPNGFWSGQEGSAGVAVRQNAQSVVKTAGDG